MIIFTPAIFVGRHSQYEKPPFKEDPKQLKGTLIISDTILKKGESTKAIFTITAGEAESVKIFADNSEYVTVVQTGNEALITCIKNPEKDTEINISVEAKDKNFEEITFKTSNTLIC